MSGQGVVDWLLEGDPSVGWQAQRDLLGLSEAEWRATRDRIAEDGWGRRLLDAQDSDGRWAGGLYGPKWTSTTYTLLMLRHFGLDRSNPRAVTGARVLLDQAYWVDGGVFYWSGSTVAERCVNGMVLSLVSYFDVGDDRSDDIAELLLRARLDDGGWNCRDYKGHTHHSSFNTTISVLEGLTEWKRRTAVTDADSALATGREFMLAHQMFRSHTTGEVIDEAWTRFSFPPRWHYDVLRGLDHLQDVDAERDERAKEAIDLLMSRRQPNGRWPIGPRYTGKRHFTMEEGRQGGRWNTLRALRVLKWWEG